MMNKYQEALEFLRSENVTALGNDNFELLYFHLDNIEELVDKATPRVPSYWGDGYDDKGNIIYDMYDCPECGESYEIDYEKYDYCPECGQAFDWSDKEWKN